jgi:hypothetical protein
MELLLEKDGSEPLDDDNVRIRSGLTQVNHLNILRIVVPGFGLLQRRELQNKKDAGQCTIPFEALQSGLSSGKNFPTVFLHQGPRPSGHIPFASSYFSRRAVQRYTPPCVHPPVALGNGSDLDL